MATLEFFIQYIVDGDAYDPTPEPTCTVYNGDLDEGASLGSATVTKVKAGVYKGAYTEDSTTKYNAVGDWYTSDATVTSDHFVTTYGKEKWDVLAILEDTGTTLPASIAAIAAWVAANVSSSITAGSITQIKGTSWDFQIDDLTLKTEKQIFVIKTTLDPADEQSILYIDTVTGLVYVKGSLSTEPTKAILTYIGTTLRVVLDIDIAEQLPHGEFIWRVKSFDSVGKGNEPYGGTFTITDNGIDAVS